MLLKPCKCNVCGTIIDWEGIDDEKGTIWECEICGRDFCVSCFSKAFSRETFDKMFNDGDLIKCPSCFRESAG